MFSSEENQRKKFKKKKRRRTNEKMKTIIKNIEKEIENQLEAKNERNDFTTSNIEAILKEVIMDEDIKEMVRQTIQQGDSKSTYEPKLTRAKIRELLKLRPDLSFPILWPITTKRNTNFVSECLSLINENYSENSSEDEEYKPDKEDQIMSDLSPVSTLNGLADTSTRDISTADSSCSKDNTHSAVVEQEENIGQRTRSKLPLTDTPLEVIEQAFVPPDITLDMYETECDNEDWLNFIKRFVQPLDDTKYSEPTDMDDDPDDDPEYNILNDVETVDKEELRKDRGVDVPRREVHDLIAELFRDCEPMNPIIDDMRFNRETNLPQSEDSIPFDVLHADDVSTPLPFDVFNNEEIPAPADSIATETPSANPKSVDNKDAVAESYELPVLIPAQRSLLDQQMRQHVQMLTMNFLQFHSNPINRNYADEMKTLLFSIKNLSGDNDKSAFSAINLKSAVRVVNEWEKTHPIDPHPKLNIFERFSKKKNPPRRESFSKDLMKAVTMSDAFLYPLLLPHRPFISYIQNAKYKTTLTESEEWLLAVGLEEFVEYVNQKGENKNEDKILNEAIEYIITYLLPNFTKSFLRKYIKKRCKEPKPNCIKHYFKEGKAPALTNYVIPVVPKPLFKQPSNLIPDVWAEYIDTHFLVVKLK